MTNRNQQLATQLKLALEFEKESTPQIELLLKKPVDIASRVYEETGSINTVQISIMFHQLNVQDYLELYYRKVALAFANKNFREITKATKSIRLETRDANDTFIQLMETWISRYGLEAAQNISATTTANIINAITQGQKEGASNTEIANNIVNKVGGEISPMRAKLIAVTETHNAATFASLESTKIMNDELDLGLKKEWLSAEDSRTRPAHAAVDGVVINMDEDFIVGGVRMSRPADPRGGASNIIRCRCALGWVVPD